MSKTYKKQSDIILTEQETQYNCVCKKCKSSFIYKPDEIWWDENGYGYSTALVRCSYCNCINVVKYINDNGID